MVQLHIQQQTDLIESLNPHPDCLALHHFASLSDFDCWAQVMAHYRQLSQEYSKQVLFVLDDAEQCAYTAMHAAESEELYFDEEIHFAQLDACARADAEQNRALYELRYVQQQLQRPEFTLAFSDIASPLYYDLIDGQVLVEINANPVPLLDQVLQVKLVDAPNCALKFAALPNGYFDADLNPFQSFSLIQHLEKNYGLALMGIGASLLAFIKTEAFKPQQLAVLMNDLCMLYHFDPATQHALQQHLITQDYLILSYNESLVDYASCYGIDAEA